MKFECKLIKRDVPPRISESGLSNEQILSLDTSCSAYKMKVSRGGEKVEDGDRGGGEEEGVGEGRGSFYPCFPSKIGSCPKIGP